MQKYEMGNDQLVCHTVEKDLEVIKVQKLNQQYSIVAKKRVIPDNSILGCINKRVLQACHRKLFFHSVLHL